MKRVCIGIEVSEQPERLLATLESVRLNTTDTAEVVLLPDGPDALTVLALKNLTHLKQLGSESPLGRAACLNRLARGSDADVLVLLESGDQVAPRWLDHLLAALNNDPRNGLAGPSTNRSWNEQQIYPRCGSSPADINRAAREAELKFGAEARELTPLYSLADFCYVVRRDVFDSLVAADQNYGRGPCWEMDFNIRAARAGFRGVWAAAAFVHRAPLSRQRKSIEARLFEANKRLYQNKFCGARLRGEKTSFRSHCRGDACPNFAPNDLIQIRQPPPLPSMTIEETKRLRVLAPKQTRARQEPVKKTRHLVRTPPGEPAEKKPPIVALSLTNAPLVSCIMPTHNRRNCLPQAIRCFLRQDYANLELLIVDDGSDPIRDLVPAHERIRYLRQPARLRIGAKRNLACEAARGEFIVHCDDDDWYPPHRITAQVGAMIERNADISGTSRILYYDAFNDQAWEYRYGARNRSWVGGNTLAYRKSLWERNKFPDIQIGEDSRFIWSRKSESVCDLADPELCVAAIHNSNTSRKVTSGPFWHATDRERVYDLLGDDRFFYRTTVPGRRNGVWPLVSCIMPTMNRRSFVPLALKSFAAQDYPNKELVIIDDGEDRIEDLVTDLPGVRYFSLPRRTTIGAKRNLACEHAQGEFIAHWDDDDWYAPDRLRYQVSALLAEAADMTGLINSYALELPGGDFWTILPTLHRRMFVGDVHGGTLVYRKDLLTHGLRYPEINLAEDAGLLASAVRTGKRLLRLANPGLFIYVRHGRNAWRQYIPGRFIALSGWQRIDQPKDFSPDALAAYREAAARLR
jgi:glycosyltransferase involved in cell wall biosynthesis